eukprot:1800250-Pleurochrysis_carterae.AAC.1
MDERTQNDVLPHLVALTYPAGSSGFDIRYSISAAKFPGTSGRNFLFTSQALASRTQCFPLPPPFPPPLPAQPPVAALPTDCEQLRQINALITD